MGKLLLALLIVLAPGSALAQATVQAGPWTAGHIPVYGNRGSSQTTLVDSANFGSLPTIAANACGSVVLGTIGGSDVAGTLQVGTGSGNVTSCIASFTTPHPAAPAQCQLTAENAIAANWTATGAYVSALTTAGFTITGLNLSNAQYGYFCL